MSALVGLGGNCRPLPSGTDGDHGDLRSRPSAIGGDPTAEDLAKAKEIVSPDETILGVYRIAEGSDVDIAVLRHYEIGYFYPIYIFSPCLLASYTWRSGVGTAPPSGSSPRLTSTAERSRPTRSSTRF